LWVSAPFHFLAGLAYPSPIPGHAPSTGPLRRVMVQRMIPGSASNPAMTGKGRGGKRPASTGEKKFTPEQAKAAFLDWISRGYNIQAACDRVGRSRKTYEYWRKNDPEFLRAADVVMSTRKVDTSTREEKRVAGRSMGFTAWREKYLRTQTYWHQLQWIDMLEGREPRDLHPAQVYEPGKPGRLLVNTPPGHAKSTTLTMDYVTYRICTNPAVKVAIISKTSDMAEDLVHGIKTRLTHPDYADLIKDFAPEGGFLATADEWSGSRIRLAAADRDPEDKDPTLQALGIGSQVYGKRLNLILVDDAIDGENAAGWQKQMRWLQTEVGSRPGPSGKIIVVGTRIAPADLYYQLRNPENFSSGKSPWTYLTQPAVLEEAPDRKDWVTLWPRAARSWYGPDEDCWCDTDYCKHGDENGEYPRWDGAHIGSVKDDVDQNVWLQAYMQLEVGGDAVFPGYAIQQATNKGRRHGKHGGMQSVPEGLYVIGSVDPATSGAAALLVGAVDRVKGQRYIYDAWNVKHPTPRELKERIKAITVEYGVHEWRIEKTGLLTMFTQDFELNQWLTSRGVRLTTHYTGKNKFDVGFGVASMQPLFGTYQDMDDGDRKVIAEPMIELPRHEGDIVTLVHQLSIWTPELDPKRTPCDMVMALWFFEVGARDRCKVGDIRRPRQFSGMTPPRDRKKAAVFDLSEFRQRAG